MVKVAPPTPAEIGRLRDGAVLIGFLDAPETRAALAARDVTAFAMEAIPRISRAQSMDALSSQSTLAGYKAVIVAAEQATRLLPMMTTAAGTIPPASVLVLGAGVAGLQALATAHRLGARTTGLRRPAGDGRAGPLRRRRLARARHRGRGRDGYARELTDAERAAQQQALTDAIKTFDIVITTALVPGRPAPRLVTEEAVAGMRPGSVIVDLAGETGGNCELTEPGRVTTGTTSRSPRR